MLIVAHMKNPHEHEFADVPSLPTRHLGNERLKDYDIKVEEATYND